MSTILYRVCIPIPNIIGIARFHNDFRGLIKKDASLDSDFGELSINYRIIGNLFYRKKFNSILDIHIPMIYK
tara:strand:+ start:368 stop:583 length:216 start_codon:yes stop_codon:yes gene_type:complete